MSSESKGTKYTDILGSLTIDPTPVEYKYTLIKAARPCHWRGWPGWAGEVAGRLYFAHSRRAASWQPVPAGEVVYDEFRELEH